MSMRSVAKVESSVVSGVFEMGEAGTNYEGPTVQKGARGPKMLQMFYFLGSTIIFRLYSLTPVTLQLGVSVFDLMVRFLAGPSLLRGPNPLSAAVAVSMADFIVVLAIGKSCVMLTEILLNAVPYNVSRVFPFIAF
jgi:hypothetical protein